MRLLFFVSFFVFRLFFLSFLDRAGPACHQDRGGESGATHVRVLGSTQAPLSDTTPPRAPLRRRPPTDAPPHPPTRKKHTALGGGAAAALALLSHVSLQYYTRGHLCKPATTAALAVAAAVGWAMHGRYVASGGKFMPAGAVAATSGAMVAFYAWSLALGPLPPVGKGSSSKGAGGGGGKGKAAAAASRR